MRVTDTDIGIARCVGNRIAADLDMIAGGGFECPSGVNRDLRARRRNRAAWNADRLENTVVVSSADGDCTRADLHIFVEPKNEVRIQPNVEGTIRRRQGRQKRCGCVRTTGGKRRGVKWES